MNEKILQKLRDFIKEKIPLIDYTELQIIHVNHKDCLVKIPFLAKNKNHLNSMYFGALAVGADCAGGLMALYQIMEQRVDLAMVFKDFSANFLYRPEYDVYFHCADGELITKTIEEAKTSGERASCHLHIEAYTLHNNTKTAVATFQLTLSMKSSTPK